MNRVNKHNEYSAWRKNLNTQNKYCMDIDFVEYCFVNNKIVPYALLEMTEIDDNNELESCTWKKNLNFKKNHVKLLELISKNLNIPWFLVLTKVIKGKRYFKIYNNFLTEEKIINEYRFVKILETLKNSKIEC